MSAKGRALLDVAAPDRSSSLDKALEHEHVVEIQRGRMLTAMAEAVSEQGVGSVSVAQVVGRAGVSRRTFYEVFSDCEDCFLATVEAGIERARERVLPAYRSAASWCTRVRCALVGLVLFFEEDPFLARVLVVESLGAGRRSLELRSRVFAQVIDDVHAGGNEARGGTEIPRLTAEGVVGGVLSVIHSRLLEGGSNSLVEIVNPLMGMVVLPYLGSAAALREVERSVETTVIPTPAPPRNVLKDLEMRLTYRTIRVLLSVASHPGSSNRAIGDVAGISDQGQISKLLARLERLRLIENMRTAHVRGASNVWRLTERGEEVAGVLAARATRN